MKTHQPLMRTTITAGAAIAKQLLVGLTGSLCAADAKPLGASEIDIASGDQCPVITHGIALVLSGAAITAGDKLKANSSAKAITWATSGEVVGWALDTASGADEAIRVLLA